MTERPKLDPNVVYTARAWVTAVTVISVATVAVVLFSMNPHLIFGVP